MNGRTFFKDTAAIFVVLIIVASVWLTQTNRWRAANWAVPLSYGETAERADVLWLLAGMKAAQEGHIHFFQRISIPELGAPFAANWDDFPWTEKIVFIFPGMLARGIGLFPALNAAVLLSYLLAGLGFYLAARAMRANRVWAITGALIFAIAPFSWGRQPQHLNVALCWHVPLFLCVCRWIVDGLPLRGRRWWAAVAVAAVTGCFNMYYAFLFAQLAALSGIAAAIRFGWRKILPAALLAAVTAAVLVAMNVNTLITNFAEGRNAAAVVRNYFGLEFYALKPVDLVMPVAEHRLTHVGYRYLQQAALGGEVPMSAYLGLIGIASMTWLSAETILRLIRGRQVAFEAGMTGWIVLFSIVGGVNGLLGVFGFQLFRATNRYSIAILALVLIFAARRLSAVTRLQDRWAMFVSIGLLLLAFYDQTLPAVSDEQISRTKALVDSDSDFARRLEERLGQRAMIFQWPHVRFPEERAGEMMGCDEFRPYLHSRGLRYSYGAVKGRSDWAAKVAKLELPHMIDALESYGFAAVLIDLRADVSRAQQVANEFGEAGRGEGWQSDSKDLLVFFLEPSMHPRLPDRSAAP